MSKRKLRATLEIDGRTGRLTSVFPEALDEGEYKVVITALARIMRPSESDGIVRLLTGFGGRGEGAVKIEAQAPDEVTKAEKLPLKSYRAKTDYRFCRDDLTASNLLRTVNGK